MHDKTFFFKFVVQDDGNTLHTLYIHVPVCCGSSYLIVSYINYIERRTATLHNLAAVSYFKYF